MFAGVTRKAPKAERLSVAPSKSKTPTGRERLQFFDQELIKARSAVTELEQRVETLESIGQDAIAAKAALADLIGRPDGVEQLRAHSEGRAAADSAISQLIAAEKSTSEAAAVAAATLPRARDDLDRAHGEATRLSDERSAEIGRYMTTLIDEVAIEYLSTFNRLSRLRDQLAGFATVASSNGGEIMLTAQELLAPRFALPALSGGADFDPLLRSGPNAYGTEQSAKQWAAVQSRLESDVEADLSDLI